MAKKSEQPNEDTDLSFEKAIAELTDIVDKVEQGEIPLEESLRQYEKGMTLIKHCRTVLQQAADNNCRGHDPGIFGKCDCAEY